MSDSSLILSSENLTSMVIWLAELVVASWALSYGAEHLSARYGAKFVGRTILSLATTTRISRSPLKGINVSTFRLDKIFLLVTAIVSALLFVDGYNVLDGFIFTGFFVVYIILALFEMRSERNDTLVKSRGMSNELDKQPEEILKSNEKDSVKERQDDTRNDRSTARLTERTLRSLLVFVAGTIGIVIGAGPFIHSLEGFSAEIGISVIVLAVIISPIAGEMPEKISLMILARKGALGASIAIANVLGSKILNNTLLLAVAVFGAMYHAGFFTVIELTPVLMFQVVLVTVITIIALIPMFKKEIGLKTGMMLLSMYMVSIAIQFFLPHE